MARVHDNATRYWLTLVGPEATRASRFGEWRLENEAPVVLADIVAALAAVKNETMADGCADVRAIAIAVTIVADRIPSELHCHHHHDYQEQECK